VADRADVKVYGYAELAAGTRILAGRIEEQAGQEFEKVAGGAADTTRARVPRRSGRLAGSVQSGAAEQGQAFVGYGGGVPYAGWIDFGGTRGRPYVRTGRYLFPTALNTEGPLTLAGSGAAVSEIRRMRWPPTRTP
jgi:hypothetical protein